MRIALRRPAIQPSQIILWRPSLRAGVLVGSAVVVICLALAIALSVADHLRRAATDSAIGNVEAIVRGYVDPILSADSLGIGAQLEPEVEDELARLVASGDMRRINVWTKDGRIIYSTEAGLQGQRLGISHELAGAFAGESVTGFGDRDSADDAASQLPSRYLELYVPIRGRTDANPIGVFEVYVDARPIEQGVEATRRDVFLIALAAGSVLMAVLWLAFGGASRLLSAQNRRLSQLNARLDVVAIDLGRREARFRSLVQNSSDVVAVIDAETRITYESDAVKRVLGHDPAQRIGRSFADLTHPEDAALFRALVSGLLAASGTEQAAEFRLRHADGSWRWVDAICLNMSHDAAVGGVLLNYRDVTERKRLEGQLQHEAFHDSLTGLSNRALFSDRVTHALSRASRDSATRLAVLFVDLDDFKVVNDSLGHAAGDELLTLVAERIRACLRRADTPARLGGDEFGILLEEASHETAAEIADRILSALSQPFALAARQLFVGASIGIAMGSDGRGAPAECETADELLRNADAAMYTAKSHGKGRYEFYEVEMHASALRRLEVRGRMESSLEAGDFVLCYQPIVELVSNEIVGVEALVRWRQPDGRLAPPAEFIPLAEETGLIVALGTWVLEESLRQAAEWRRMFPGHHLRMAVNVSPRQLQEPGLAVLTRNALAASGFPPHDLVVELTESALLHVGDPASATIEQLKQLGVRISLDDFGTGYSSLSHLRNFPIDTLKIDHSFVEGIDGVQQDERALVRSIIRLAHSLRLETVAEGIERPAQLVQLRALGCRFGQGFLFSEPIESAAMSDLLRQRSQLVG
jgi:diguanylate cyclase (GGDEF)-like protein/PAS domain S-box-containing protein